jgi:uncharacterized membrane protein
LADNSTTGVFLLAHHYPEDYSRCYRIAGRKICARCLGLYPLLVLTLAFQIGMRTRAAYEWEPWLVAALTLPAVIDWARGRFDPATGINPFRTFTGVLLGIALGRTVYLNMVRPGNKLSVVHFAGLATVALVVEVVARPHRLKRRLESGSPKEP